MQSSVDLLRRRAQEVGEATHVAKAGSCHICSWTLGLLNRGSLNSMFQVAFDGFDKPETLAHLWPRLVRGYAMEALGDRARCRRARDRRPSPARRARRRRDPRPSGRPPVPASSRLGQHVDLVALGLAMAAGRAGAGRTAGRVRPRRGADP